MAGKIKILDGGMGRELKRRGAPFRQPEWSALALIEGPQHVLQAHDAFVQSGAEVLTTNSYAVVPFHIGEARFQADGLALARLSGELARQSADKADHPVTVAGSLPPALGSYRPDLFVEADSLRIHQTLIAGLDASVDVWLAETQSSTAEMRAARAALGSNPKPLWIAMTLADGEGCTSATLRSGEPVAEAVAVALDLGAQAVLFNCSQPEVMGAAVRAAKQVVDAAGSSAEIGVYANAFPPQNQKATANAVLLDIRADLHPQAYVQWAKTWVAQGATLVGGCCGIAPEHIAELRAALA